jgi:hypothetical protein
MESSIPRRWGDTLMTKKKPEAVPAAQPTKRDKAMAKVASEKADKGPRWNPTDPKNAKRINIRLPKNMKAEADGGLVRFR